MTVRELATKLAVDVAGTSRVDIKTIRKIEEHIRDVFKIVVIAAEWPFRKGVEPAFNTVASQAEYDLSSAALYPISVRIDQRPIKFIPLTEAQEKIWQLDITQGTPVAWSVASYDEAISAYQIRLIPIPSGVLPVTVATQLMPVDLASNDTIPLPSDILAVVKQGAIQRIHADDGATEKATASGQIFADLMRLAISRFNPTKGNRPVRQVSSILDGESGWPYPDPRFS